MLGLFVLLRDCGGPFQNGGVSTMEEKRGGGSIPPSEIELLRRSLLAPISW